MTNTNNTICSLFGFAHNFFDLFTVCWITMLTLLFYKSTNLSNEMLYQDTKYLIIGFLYSFILCLIFCGLPFITSNYGFAKYYCSFRYNENYDNVNQKSETALTTFWRYSFAFITALNNIFNALCLFKTNSFYSRKLKIVKNQNRNEYKLMLIYVWVFRIFPIVLLISRAFKAMSRLIEMSFDNENFNNLVQYFNAFFFASNGIFDSLACIFFFRGVFWCCFSNNAEDNLSEEKEGSDLNDLNDFGTEINEE